MSELKLGRSTPREYPWVEAFRGRVWRSRSALYGREVTLFSVIALLYGILLDEGLLWEIGILGIILGVVWSGAATLQANLVRLRLVRRGEWVEGEVTSLVSLRLWHEFLRGKAHRSFLVKYQYQATESLILNGEMVLCRCAYDRLAQTTGTIPVVVDPQKPKKSLLLRLAVMRIPH